MISETEIKQQIGEFIKKRINVNMRHPNHSGDASHAYKIIYKECQFTLYHFKDSISLNAKVCAEGVISINITDKVCLIKDLLGKYNGYKVYYDACSMEACQAENTFNLIADVVSMLSLMSKEGVIIYGNEVNIIITEPAKIKTALVCCWEISKRLSKRPLCQHITLPPGFERLEPYMYLATSDDDERDQIMASMSNDLIKEFLLNMETYLVAINLYLDNCSDKVDDIGITLGNLAQLYDQLRISFLYSNSTIKMEE